MTLGNGKPCKKCGTSDWYSDGHCKQCKQNYCGSHKTQINERSKQWRKDNPEKYKDAKRKWEKENRELLNYRKRTKQKTEADKKRTNANGRRWAAKNKGKLKAKAARRRTNETKSGGNFTGAEWNSLCDAYKNKCLKCGKTFPRGKLTADHVLPIVMGGDSNISNIQPLCKSCNSSKGAKHIDYRKGNVKRWVQKKLIDFLSD